MNKDRNKAAVRSDEFELKFPKLSRAEKFPSRAKLGTSIFKLKPYRIFFDSFLKVENVEIFM